MKYHPDRNAEPRAAEGFILVNEAYEYLSDKGRREVYSRPRTGRERDEQKRKASNKDWEDHHKEAARGRAAAYASGKVEDFEKSRIYRAAAALDQFYNYLFIGIGVMIAILPVIGALNLTEAEKLEFNYYGLILPVILGGGFVFGIWYFIFNLKESD